MAIIRARGPTGEPAGSLSLLQTANGAHRAGRTAAAGGLCKHICARVPKDAAEARRCLAILLVQTGRQDEATASLRAERHLTPRDTALLNDLGTLDHQADRRINITLVYGSREQAEAAPPIAPLDNP